MYQRLPTADEAAEIERDLGPAGKFLPLSRWQRGHEALAVTQNIVSSHPVPWFLREGGSVLRAHETTVLRRYIPRGSMLAYTQAFNAGGRTWLLSSDGTVVPADRVRPYRVSTFAGIEPGAKFQLPLAWTRGAPAARFWRNRDGNFEARKTPWPPRTPVRLHPSGERTWSKGTLYIETLERAGSYPLFIERSKARIVERQKSLPPGIEPNEKWIRFSISEGTLVAYRGLTPVYVTLASPGAGGVPQPGGDLIKQSTTPLGRFRITFKHRSRDMSPEQGDKRSFWIAEVPDTQYFQQPFALHTAYWHEEFGELMSAGCINLSPQDGRWLFRFTDPPLPDGFSGVGSGGAHGRGTVILIVR